MKLLELYSEEEIYQKISLPLFLKYKTEIAGFADQKVFITKETSGEKPGPSWIYQFARDVELERCLSSILVLP